MPGTNDFLPFATGVTANVDLQAAYAANPQTGTGQQPGLARSAFNNKALRQATSIAAALAQYLVNVTGLNAVDDGNQANLLTLLGAGLTTGLNVVAKTSAYTAALKDFVLCSSASFNVTLPDASAAGVKGLSIAIKHNGTSLSQKYTLLTTGGQTIIGANGAVASGSFILCTNGEVVIVISNGTNWEVQGRVAATPLTSLGVIRVSSSSGFIFTISSATIIAGDVYSNSGNFFTVSVGGTGTSASCFGTGSPAASGTLTRVSGTGPATLTFSAFSANACAFGTTTINDLSMSRDGNLCTLTWKVATSATGSNGLNDIGLLLPNGMAIDVTKYPAFTANIGTVISVQLASAGSIITGVGQVTVPGSNAYSNSPPYFAPFSAGILRMAIAQVSPGGNYANLSSGFYTPGTTGMTWNLSVTFPVSDWQP